MSMATTENEGSSEAYMLPRDAKESGRLNGQHELMKTVFDGQLLSPSVPVDRLQAIADVGTGTGVWLRDIADTYYPVATHRSSRKFVGFDISSQQFPNPAPQGFSFQVQDVTKPFPSDFHGKFDLVHIRFLGFALKEADLESIVANVTQIVRPGGYLHWTELDLVDFHVVPDRPKLRYMAECVMEERAKRGLTRAILPTLMILIPSLKSEIPSGHVNCMTWGPELLRLVDVTTAPSREKSTPELQKLCRAHISASMDAFLGTMLQSRKMLVEDPSIPALEKTKAERDVNIITSLLEDVRKSDGELQNSDWHFDLTRIVARKAIFTISGDSWMNARNPASYE